MGTRERNWICLALVIAGIVASIDLTLATKQGRPAASVVLPISTADFTLHGDFFENDPLARPIPVAATTTKRPRDVQAHADYTEPPSILVVDDETALKLTVSVYAKGTSPDDDLKDFKDSDLLEEFNRRLALGKIVSGSKLTPVLSAPDEIRTQSADGVDEKTVTTKRPAAWTWYLRPKEIGEYPVSLTLMSKRFPNGKCLFDKKIRVGRSVSSMVGEIRGHPFHVAVDFLAGLGGLLAAGDYLHRKRKQGA
jgi:hypothetical protein